MEDLLEISFDPAANKYFFVLPAEVCDSLLLDFERPEGLKLYHAQKNELEAFRKSLLELSIATEASREKAVKIAKRNVSRGLLVLLLLVVIVFTKDLIVSAYPQLKWPLYIGTPLLAVFSCIVIFVNYNRPSLDGKGLSDTVGLIEIRQRINEEFSF